MFYKFFFVYWKINTTFLLFVSQIIFFRYTVVKFCSAKKLLYSTQRKQLTLSEVFGNIGRKTDLLIIFKNPKYISWYCKMIAFQLIILFSMTKKLECVKIVLLSGSQTPKKQFDIMFLGMFQCVRWRVLTMRQDLKKHEVKIIHDNQSHFLHN